MKRIIGVLLVSVSLIILFATYFPLARNEVEYQVSKVQGYKTKEIEPLYPDFGIVIPKINVNAKVVRDVDPYDPNIYQKMLTQGVAHAKGSALPGEEGNIFIFSHSSENFYQALQYNSIFYLLPKLDIGDDIKIYYQNHEFDYKVCQKKIVDPSDIQYLTNSVDSRTLTLMTCYPPGTDFKRYIIVAQ